MQVYETYRNRRILSSGPTHAKRKEQNAKCKAQNRAIPTIGWYINYIDSLINRSTNSRSLKSCFIHGLNGSLGDGSPHKLNIHKKILTIGS